jgi:hypothetical protein
MAGGASRRAVMHRGGPSDVYPHRARLGGRLAGAGGAAADGSELMAKRYAIASYLPLEARRVAVEATYRSIRTNPDGYVQGWTHGAKAFPDQANP